LVWLENKKHQKKKAPGLGDSGALFSIGLYYTYIIPWDRQSCSNAYALLCNECYR